MIPGRRPRVLRRWPGLSDRSPGAHGAHGIEEADQDDDDERSVNRSHQTPPGGARRKMGPLKATSRKSAVNGDFVDSAAISEEAAARPASPGSPGRPSALPQPLV